MTAEVHHAILYCAVWGCHREMIMRSPQLIVIYFVLRRETQYDLARQLIGMSAIILIRYLCSELGNPTASQKSHMQWHASTRRYVAVLNQCMLHI